MSLTRKGGSRELETKIAELHDLYDLWRDHDAIALGDSILAMELPTQRRGEVLLWLAICNLRLGQIDPGEQRLNESWSQLAIDAEPAVRVEWMITRAQLAVMKQDRRGVELAKGALAACRTLKPVPNAVEVRALNALAAAHVRAGDWTTAIGCYEEAIERAGPLFDMRRQAMMANEVAIAYRELGQPDRSLPYATRALKLVETLGDAVPLAIAENNLGWILIALGDLRGARVHLERSLEMHDATGLESVRCHVLLSLCELNLAEGNYPAGRSFAEQALAYAERVGKSASVAEAHAWIGRAAASLGETAVVDVEFAQAIDQLQRNGESERLVRCHALYSEILERRGDATRAYEHLKSAVTILMPKSRLAAAEATRR